MKESLSSNRRILFIGSIFFLFVILLSNCVGNGDNIVVTDSQGNQFAGSEACINCHKDICDSFVHTAHYLTSRLADSNTIKGSFKRGHNLFVFGNSIVTMEKREDSFYQVQYDTKFINGNVAYEPVTAKSFAVVIGSNTKGQSYLYRNRNELYQLPISYFTVISNWCNSPGYPFRPIYNRSVGARCLECHTTYAKVTSSSESQPEEFDHKQIIYGIGCEKCHGAAAEHVAYQTQHPESKIGKYILNPAKFARQQSLDMCALCHSGNSIQGVRPAFSFVLGDTLTNYFKRDSTPTDIHSIDVHGNQYGLLLASQCYKNSTTMTCNTCHNTHNKERGNTILFSQRCINCHNAKEAITCPLTAQLGITVISKNCIDCHMPVYPSKSIAVSLPGDTATRAATVRSHYISIYNEETDKIIALIRKQSIPIAK